MSTSYRLEKCVTMRDLFDGRLKQHGIVEEVVPDKTSARSRVLVDERGNYLWVYADDDSCASCLVRYGFQSPVQILEPISAEFDTEIYSEHEFKYCGYSSQEEWDAAMELLALEAMDRFYEDIVKFVAGKEPHGFDPGTIGMGKAEVAKALALVNPDLLLPQNKDEFLRAIDLGYEGEHPASIVQLDEKDLLLARRIFGGVDEPPRDPNLRDFDFQIPMRSKLG